MTEKRSKVEARLSSLPLPANPVAKEVPAEKAAFRNDAERLRSLQIDALMARIEAMTKKHQEELESLMGEPHHRSTPRQVKL
jgi:hypothetical protein